MKVIKLPHAGMIIQSASARVIFDPLFTNKIDDTYELLQALEASPKILHNEKFDGVFLSHVHNDHFNLETLNYFHRDCRIFFPKGEVVIPFLLRKLGFKYFTAISAYSPISFKEFTVFPTPSRVGFPEVGFAILSDRLKLWNLVDSVVTKTDILHLKDLYGTPDIAFVSYQALREWQMRTLSGFGTMDEDEYHRIVEIALATQARYIIPSSWDLINTICPHLNEYLAPITKQKFNIDIARKSKALPAPNMDVGDELQMGHQAIKINKNGKVLEKLGLKRIKNSSAIKKLRTTKFEIKKIRDHQGTRSNLDYTKKFIAKFIKKDFPLLLWSQEAKKNLALYRKQKIVWQLEIIFSDESSLSYFIDFRKVKLQWASVPLQPNYITQVGAGDLRKLIRGELSIYPFAHGGYLRGIDHTNRPESDQNDPLLAILNKQVTATCQTKILKKLLLK